MSMTFDVRYFAILPHVIELPYEWSSGNNCYCNTIRATSRAQSVTTLTIIQHNPLPHKKLILRNWKWLPSGILHLVVCHKLTNVSRFIQKCNTHKLNRISFLEYKPQILHLLSVMHSTQVSCLVFVNILGTLLLHAV